jgi:hypothetical protein
MRVENREQLVTAMQGVLRMGRNSIRDALSVIMQHNRHVMAPSERDEPRRISFTGDHEDEPSKAWVELWGGCIRNYVGEIVPFSLKRWGYIFWDSERLERSRAEAGVRRVYHSVEARVLRLEG